MFDKDKLLREKEVLDDLKKELESFNPDHIYEHIKVERRRQDEKWGKQRYNALYWLGILMEEVGELAKAIIEDQPYSQARKELVQVAAVAVATIEQIDEETGEEEQE